MSGIPNNPLGSLAGLQNAAGQASLSNVQLQATMNQALGQACATLSGMIGQGARYAGPPYPPPPNMTGTEFIKASLRISMEREMRYVTSLVFLIGGVCVGIAVLDAIIMIHNTGNPQLGFLLGSPVYLSLVILAYYIRKRTKKWIEVHLS